MSALLKVAIRRDIPKWSVPLFSGPAIYRGAKGGRSSGKSHLFAESLVERHICDPDYSSVCIREVQKSLKFSAKRLIEAKIRAMGVVHLFVILESVIRRRYGTGIIIFQGMQDHNAESIKSLEDFDLAWVEEAQSLSQRSLDLLIPTIRNEGSEIWFSWNPEQTTDPVDTFFAGKPQGAVCVHVNYTQNPFATDKIKQQAADWKRRDPDTYDHVWMGAYNTKSDDQVLSGCWTIEERKPDHTWDGPYYGGDWGFATDPTTLLEVYINEDDNELYVSRERYGLKIEIDDTPEFYDGMSGAKKYVVRADNARPEIISYMKRHKYPKVRSVDKWPGSVEDGISKLRSYDIVIHPDCTHTIDEARLWKYKRDRLTGDVLPKLIDGNDHCWDAIRYAIQDIIKKSGFGDMLNLAMGE